MTCNLSCFYCYKIFRYTSPVTLSQAFQALYELYPVLLLSPRQPDHKNSIQYFDLFSSYNSQFLEISECKESLKIRHLYKQYFSGIQSIVRFDKLRFVLAFILFFLVDKVSLLSLILVGFWSPNTKYSCMIHKGSMLND